jgi:hypothetical protein
MHDDNQTLLPDSFIALFLDERRRLTTPRAAIAARYELCEDLATMLVDHCKTVHFRDGVDEAEVLRRCHLGLLAPPVTVEANEAEWVVHRSAELLGWPWPGLPDPDTAVR